jgi:hypothetical protein
MRDSGLTAVGLDEIIEIVAGFPETSHQSQTGQHTALLVRKKKFGYHLVDHHGDGRVALQCKADKGDNHALVAEDPERFFLPPYMTQHGWIGLYLDLGSIDWDEVRELLTDAYLLTAPKTLARQVEAELS